MNFQAILAHRSIIVFHSPKLEMKVYCQRKCLFALALFLGLAGCTMSNTPTPKYTFVVNNQIGATGSVPSFTFVQQNAVLSPVCQQIGSVTGPIAVTAHSPAVH